MVVVPVIVSVVDERQEVTSVTELDELLDRVASDADAVLVELTCEGVVLNIGVGRNDVAVALFRASDGSPWSARTRREPAAVRDGDLTFSKDGRPYSFYPRAAILPAEMREAAREFVRGDGARPSAVAWVAESGDRQG